MSSTDKYFVPYMMNSDISGNLIRKVKHFYSYPVEDNERGLKLIVYGDNEPLSRQMWRTIFREDLNMYYSTDFPPIPIPGHKTPERCERYEKELRRFMACYIANEGSVWGLYNLATPGQDPRMHLVLANRRLERSELETDKSENSESAGGADQDARFISIESLSGQVWNLVDFNPYKYMSVGTIKVSSSTSASVEELPSNSEAASSAGPPARPPTEPIREDGL